MPTLMNNNITCTYRLKKTTVNFIHDYWMLNYYVQNKQKIQNDVVRKMDRSILEENSLLVSK